MSKNLERAQTAAKGAMLKCQKCQRPKWNHDHRADHGFKPPLHKVSDNARAGVK